MRISSKLILFAMIAALTKLGAADQTSEIFAGVPAALTRPDKSGHPLPEGEGRKVPSEISHPSVTGDRWRASINQRLDESIARLQTENAEKRSAATGVTWGGGGIDSDRIPFAATAGSSKKDDDTAMVARLLQAEGLPPGLTSVVEVESAFNPLALSPKGARGLWQLMPDTARRYGLRIERATDERTDPLKSTRAAAAYMKDLFTQFQDWPLALAAYNAGEDRVARALIRTGARDFWTLRRQGALPDETLQYVPAVLEKLERPLDALGTERATSSDAPGQSEPPAGRIAYATPAGHE